MTRCSALAVMCFVVAATACRPSANKSQPKGFESPALHFSYPGNWKITGQTLEAASEQITLEGPNNRLIIVSAFRQNTGLPLKEFAETVAAERTRNVDRILSVGGVKLTKQTRNNFEPLVIETTRKKLRGLREKFVLTVLGVDVPHLAGYLREHQGEIELLYIIQGEENDWKEVSKVFAKLAASLSARVW